MMKFLTALVLFSVLTVIYANSCDVEVNQLCSATDKASTASIDKCNSQTTVHTWENAENELKLYAKNTLKRSYELLGLAINHGTFSRNRPGFEKLFRELSDDSFEDAIKIIKYISSRGGVMTFDGMANNLVANQFHINEFQSMSAAQTIEKSLLEQAHGFPHKTHDPNTLHFIEEEFIEPKTSVLRKLTGYVHDLDKLLRTTDSSLNIFLFDEYLQK